MNPLPPNENVDRLLSAFFKAEMPDPWPAAPTASATTESAGFVAEAPRNEPAVARRDHNSRARYTLAASVALLLGTCWTLSNGIQSGNQPANRPADGASPRDILGPSNAKSPNEIRDALKGPVVAPGDKDDMFGKSN
jgi:hypothetical protein